MGLDCARLRAVCQIDRAMVAGSRPAGTAAVPLRQPVFAQSEARRGRRLIVVGTVNFAEGGVALTGPHSERAVAEWLGTSRLDRAELRESGVLLSGDEVMCQESPTAATRIDPALLFALIERGGIKPGR